MCRLVFKPTGDLSFPDKFSQDTVSQLVTIPAGSTLYRVNRWNNIGIENRWNSFGIENRWINIGIEKRWNNIGIENRFYQMIITIDWLGLEDKKKKFLGKLINWTQIFGGGPRLPLHIRDKMLKFFP